MIGIIVTGHGHFATGLTSAAKLIGGMPEHYVPVDFPEGDSTEDLTKGLSAAFDSLKGCEGILVFSDLVGGSPFKMAVELSLSRKEPSLVLSGTNLGMLLEASMSRSFIKDLRQLADTAVSAGKDQVLIYHYVEHKEAETDEGI